MQGRMGDWAGFGGGETVDLWMEAKFECGAMVIW